jgi:hypothetical protein
MSNRFANLEAACGGVLNIETLTRFQLAMREYEDFMSGMRELLRPLTPEEAEQRKLEQAK